jgi:hypothetical protein
VERSRQSKAAAIAAAIVAIAGGAPALGGELTTTAPADGVRLRGRWFEAPVRRAVQGAGQRLSDPACAAVLGDFRDRDGRPLAARLGALSLAPVDYARLVLFYDGSSDAPCRRPRVYAFTAPGSRVVRACPRLGSLAAVRPDEAEAVVIHELLHTLGLGDDRASSAWITAAVERRCLRTEDRRP